MTKYLNPYREVCPILPLSHARACALSFPVTHKHSLTHSTCLPLLDNIARVVSVPDSSPYLGNIAVISNVRNEMKKGLNIKTLFPSFTTCHYLSIACIGGCMGDRKLHYLITQEFKMARYYRIVNASECKCPHRMFALSPLVSHVSTSSNSNCDFGLIAPAPPLSLSLSSAAAALTRGSGSGSGFFACRFCKFSMARFLRR